MKQKKFADLMLECDKIIEQRTGKDGMPQSHTDAKLVLNAIGKKQRLLTTQIETIKFTNKKHNAKDFDFVYEASK